MKAAGQIIDVATSKAGERKAWLDDHLRGAPVKLEPAAADLLAAHVGEDLGRVEGLLGALSAAYGEGARSPPRTSIRTWASRATSRATS